MGSPPALSRLLPRLLGGGRDDGRPPAASGRSVHLHANRDPLRRDRPRPPVRQGLRALPRARRHAHPSLPAIQARKPDELTCRGPTARARALAEWTRVSPTSATGFSISTTASIPT